MKTSFVILHYLTFSMTSKCVDLLLDTFEHADISIVVVDNGSPNGSGDLLKQRYSANAVVSVISLEKNLGFARGNNEGYIYAIAHDNPDYIVVMNNDVLINDRSFLSFIEREYDKSPFSVLGPDIYSPYTKVHQSPMRLALLTSEEVSETKSQCIKEYKDNSFLRYYYHLVTWNVKLFLKIAHRPTQAPLNNSTAHHPHSDCVLHGACLIFSKDFIRKRQNAFNPATFMFAEEDILAHECHRDGLTMRYSPDMTVMHLEDVSTNAAIKHNRSRIRMKLKNTIDSMNVLTEVIGTYQ